MPETIPDRPAVYLRVSTAKQVEANGVTAQRESVHRWLQLHGIDPANVPEYIDEGVSGKAVDRPAWEALVAEAQRGAINAIVCYSLSRAGRSLGKLLKFVEEMRTKGVKLYFVKEQFDLDSHYGRFFLSVLGALAELEAEIIRERAIDGIRSKIAHTGKWGNPGRISKEAWREAAMRVQSGTSRASDEIRLLGVEQTYGFRRLKAERERLTAV